MNEKPEIKPMGITPLKHICMTIGELPSSYLESMTYYEQLLWLTKFLQERMIPALDNNALAVEELQRLFIELQNYVNNYFDNLDVQEEINNKLDQMLESGTLIEIIDQFIQTTAVWCYDNVNDMKNADNLINGSYAKTLGYYSVNDGGGATYKITNVQNTNEHQELLNNGLYATLIHTNEIIINQLGAKDETGFDCLSMFTKAFTIPNVTKIKLLSGRYRISTKLSIPAGFTIEGVENQFNYSEITLISSDSCVIEVEQRNITLDNLLINKNGEFTCYGINGALYNNEHYNLTIKRCRLVGFTTAIRLTGSIWWESSIEDTRVSLSEIGAHIVNSFDLILKQLYTDRCNRSVALYGINTITFYNCNIGVINEGIKVLFGADGQTNNLTFIGCNFEYDNQLESSDGGFIDVATNKNSDCYITMINNRFTINGQNENVKSLAFNRHTTISFLNNFYYPNNETDNPTSFFNTLRPPKLEIGCLKFLGGNESLPRPNYSGANKPAVLDLENGGIPHCNIGSTDLQYYQNVTNGQMIYGDSDKVLRIYANDGWRKINYVDL